jgi:hypothetical protein
MRLPATARQDIPSDVGTLWTMRRLDHYARCAVMAWPGEWELRVIVDGDTLLAERSPRGAEAFALADQWKRRMLNRGWHQVTPRAAHHTPRARRSAGANVRRRSTAG